VVHAAWTLSVAGLNVLLRRLRAVCHFASLAMGVLQLTVGLRKRGVAAYPDGCTRALFSVITTDTAPGSSRSKPFTRPWGGNRLDSIPWLAVGSARKPKKT
jgi:hypothetical protein